MKIEKETPRHVLDDNWRTYTCGCMCWHSDNEIIHRQEFILEELNEGGLP